MSKWRVEAVATQRPTVQGNTCTEKPKDVKLDVRPWWRRLVFLSGGFVLGLTIGSLLIYLSPLLTPNGDKAAFYDLVLAGSQQLFSRTDRDPMLAVSHVAPDFTLSTLNGETIRLSDLRGQPVFINFWASWCAPCRREMPELVRVYEAHRADGLNILALNVTAQDSLPEVKAFVEEFELPFPVLLDETGAVSLGLYQLRGLPTSVFINREGAVVRIYVGAMTGAQLDQFVGEILP